jgi:hypothetical protein
MRDENLAVPVQVPEHAEFFAGFWSIQSGHVALQGTDEVREDVAVNVVRKFLKVGRSTLVQAIETLLVLENHAVFVDQREGVWTVVLEQWERQLRTSLHVHEIRGIESWANGFA